jgi:hypothetical protein
MILLVSASQVTEITGMNLHTLPRVLRASADASVGGMGTETGWGKRVKVQVENEREDLCGQKGAYFRKSDLLLLLFLFFFFKVFGGEPKSI